MFVGDRQRRAGRTIAAPVTIESGAGAAASFSDADYEASGATLAKDAKTALAKADMFIAQRYSELVDDADVRRPIWQRIAAERDRTRQAILDIVGGGDPGDLPQRVPGFNYLGDVENLEAYLNTVRLALVPDEIGGGFKHRVLTHVFHRTPLLAVRWAVNGMGLRPDVDFAVAEDLAGMAAIIPTLIDDLPRLNRLQAEAFAHCDGAFDWSRRGTDLHRFIQSLTKPARAAA